MKRLILISVSVFLGMMLRAQVYDLVVISDCESGNMASARNISAGKLDDRWNRRTAYAQSPDASFGIKLEFGHPGENMLHKGDAITLNTTGCTVTLDESTKAMTVSGIKMSNISRCEPGAQIVEKLRNIDELSNEDIYTYVTLKDLDIVFKDGSYSNIWETLVPKMDACASLLRDANSNTMYMLIGTACSWRRNGKVLAQGNVNVSGIIVSEQLRRYGPSMGKFGIRPVFESDIVQQKAKSVWSTVCGWMKPEGSTDNLDFEISGVVQGLFKKGIVNDKIYNDIGNLPALFWTDSGAEIKVYSGYTSVSREKDGLVGNGSIMFIAPTVDWYEWNSYSQVCGSKAFYISLNASKYKTGVLQLCFEWSAGTGDGNKCWGFPIDWKVEYSVDGGKQWFVLKENTTGETSIMLHSLGWGDAVIKGSGHDFKLQNGYDCAMGPQQHAFTLPQTVLGQKDLLLRLSPASTWVAKHRVKISDTYKDMRISSQRKDLQTWIRFDSIKIDYSK